ncbi:MAG TPA: hypothetical protein VEX11_05360, partial [Acetobacteraceae bacterium]|nr:hypothetical protein [Acetobacteraceae bacterium]
MLGSGRTRNGHVAPSTCGRTTPGPASGASVLDAALPLSLEDAERLSRDNQNPSFSDNQRHIY